MTAWALAVLISWLWSTAPVAATANATWQTWGPYRPGLYFGVRPQVPETLLMGLMWADGRDRASILKTLRDTCEQDDGMDGYGWTMYDTRVGGSQAIYDKDLHIDLNTDFIKQEGCCSWAVRVTGTPLPTAPGNARTAIILHAAVEGAAQGGSRSLSCRSKDGGSSGEMGAIVTCRGEIPALGSFELHVDGDTRNKDVGGIAVRSLQVPEDKIWQAKSVFRDQVRDAPPSKDENAINDEEPHAGNMHFIQMTFEGPFTVTFAYNNLGASPIDPPALEASLDAFRSEFPVRVDRVFPRDALFQHEIYGAFAQQLLSNLLGGLGFFHGDSKVDYSHAPEYEETELEFWVGTAAAMARASPTTTKPISLLSFTPSRPFFPRGFLWDEGFHLLPVIEWDLDLAVSVLQSWLGQMDEDGWIAREQILGPEARSKVPDKFQVQYQHHANPPTLSLLFPILIERLTNSSTYTGNPSVYVSSREKSLEMLKELYPLLSRHYEWFRRTQAGNFSQAYPRPDDTIPGVGYRWRGRTPMHTLASGLDDYPRANPPHPGELHVDALAWVGASARALQHVAEYLGNDADAATYEKHLAEVKHNLDVLHWDPAEKVYCDTTLEADKDQNDWRYQRVCHQGYISLFPLFLGLLNATHPHLASVLDLLSDDSKLWSPFGLRSLSAADANYGKDENYWRGAVWMNLNVLAVLRLRDIGIEDQDTGKGPTAVQKRALTLAADLRGRLVETVITSWQKTGFIWEQYSDKTGEGTHSRAFTGWTACVILLMGLEFAVGSEEGKDTAPSAFGMSTWSFLALVAAALLIVVFRRRLLSLAARGVKRGHNWGHRRTRGRYEQVIDLDERQHIY